MKHVTALKTFSHAYCGTKQTGQRFQILAKFADILKEEGLVEIDDVDEEAIEVLTEATTGNASETNVNNQ
jgi:hypothetical protein